MLGTSGLQMTIVFIIVLVISGFGYAANSVKMNNSFIVGQKLAQLGRLSTMPGNQPQQHPSTIRINQPVFVKKQQPMWQRRKSLIMVKLSMIGEQLTRLKTCYDRFQHCSKILHPTFCSLSNENLSFYLWAKQIAYEIMNEEGVNCPAQLIGQFSKLEQKQQPSVNYIF